MGQMPCDQADQARCPGKMAHGHTDQAPRDQVGHDDLAVAPEPTGSHSVAARLRVRISRGVHHRLGRGRKDGNNGRA